MKQRPLGAIAIVLIALVGAACGTGAPSASPTPAAATYAGYETAFCAAFTSLIIAVGNPDAGTPSVLSKSLDDAVTAGDAAAAESVAATITRELESGRQEAALAGGWEPGKSTTVAIDHVLVAFEAEIAAKVAGAKHAAGAVDPQTALEKAGGVEAWSAWSGALARWLSPPTPLQSRARPFPARLEAIRPLVQRSTARPSYWRTRATRERSARPGRIRGTNSEAVRLHHSAGPVGFGA